MPAASATAAARCGSKCSSTTERWNPMSAVGLVHTFHVGESGPKKPWSSRGRSEPSSQWTATSGAAVML
ncbi:Uncharacterised protein [Mycobacteroides abscessus subsp. abscessus]|nr:Uncharacterised protein [Mycobacteroides abscessus subsp. abscessus]